MSFKTIGVKEKDKEFLKELSKKFGLKEYEVISKLINYYERLEVLQHYLGCDSIEDLFDELEQLIPKSRKQLIIAKTNQYLDELKKLDIPEPILDELREVIFPIILNGRVR